MENLKYLTYKKENNEVKYLNNTRTNRFLNVKNTFLELENDFIGLKDGKLRERELKIKKIPIIVSIDETDRFERNEMKRNRPIENTWYWLINYIPEPIRKTVGGFKDKFVNLFKANTPENYSKQTVGRRKKLSKLKIQKQSEEDNN